MSNIRSRVAMMAATSIASPATPDTPVLPLVLPETGFLRQTQVLAFVPISKSTLWRRIQARSFPAPVKLSARVTAWRAEDIRRWIVQQGQPG
ncbi:helix-turn-helix transcriptional regulator [Ferribacterium limneticum]|uniref:helix-turn-helix transcriptional regulator n=1 Tax=Ferribacterium limneticum TaxID=76259 RepID=UPI001CFB83F8|nr:AlpA family phage regulatory protein [Ferribacterium limneticum]UCV17857.1 AlpA family phage regulatory protein [Ferribacterium limneticum]